MGDISPPIFDRGMAYVIIPPPNIVKSNNILAYLYKYSDKINRFCSKNGWFLMILAKFYQKISPKMQNFGQSGPKNCFFFYPSPALNLRLKVFAKLRDSSCKSTKFSSFWGGRHPPNAQACNWHSRATKSSHPCRKTDLRLCRLKLIVEQRNTPNFIVFHTWPETSLFKGNLFTYFVTHQEKTKEKMFWHIVCWHWYKVISCESDSAKIVFWHFFRKSFFKLNFLPTGMYTPWSIWV